MPGLARVWNRHCLLLKACMQEELEDHLVAVCTFYKDDFEKDLLCSQLQTFAVDFQEVMVKELATTVNFSIFDVKMYFLFLMVNPYFCHRSDGYCS